MTDAERKLWRRLCNRQMGGAKFRRQVPVGPYVVDFLCIEARLVIEIDGGQHAEDGEKRTRYLQQYGYRVIRFWNNEVLGNLDGVLTRISIEVGGR